MDGSEGNSDQSLMNLSELKFVVQLQRCYICSIIWLAVDINFPSYTSSLI